MCLDLSHMKTKRSNKNETHQRIQHLPRIVIIKRSALGSVWSPEYYIPKCQAEAVTTVLNNATMGNIVPAVKDMITKKRARVKSAAKQGFWCPAKYVYLNNNTVRLIRDSELGQFALSFKKEKEEECV